MPKRVNKEGNPYDKEVECFCNKQTPDLMFFGGADLPGVKSKGIYCHCKRCSGKIYYEKYKIN
jgi:hypothetical protein